MFTVLYRWKIKPELETQFIESWSEVTALYRKCPGAYGSRLHRDNDGLFWAYAQWDSDADRQAAFREPPLTPARERMAEAIAARFDEIVLDIVSDHLAIQDKE
ncbi:MAG: antibiotic biosynthesis monooxygenase [Pyrinomonadaceae bacterium]